MTKFFRSSDDGDFINKVREDAIDLAQNVEHDDTFLPIRERIHGSPTPQDLEDTKKFLEKYKREGKKGLEKKAQTLYNGLLKLYDQESFRDRISKNISKISNPYLRQEILDATFLNIKALQIKLLLALSQAAIKLRKYNLNP